MSITAFPVLARIIREQCDQNFPLGDSLAIASAANDDVTAWCLFESCAISKGEYLLAVRIP